MTHIEIDLKNDILTLMECSKNSKLIVNLLPLPPHLFQVPSILILSASQNILVRIKIKYLTRFLLPLLLEEEPSLKLYLVSNQKSVSLETCGSKVTVIQSGPQLINYLFYAHGLIQVGKATQEIEIALQVGERLGLPLFRFHILMFRSLAKLLKFKFFPGKQSQQFFPQNSAKLFTLRLERLQNYYGNK